jgi:hypothetical protein
MPAFFSRTSTTFERAQWKVDKECFEKYDETETILHAAIVESLSQGTIRMINTQNVAGIASLSALQLVGVIHKLYSTPTLQDITTVETDLKRPLNNFDDFLDHVTDRINHYEFLRSFNQQVSNITKSKLSRNSSSAGRSLAPSLNPGSSLTTTFSRAIFLPSPTTLFVNMETFLLTLNLEAVMHSTPIRAKRAKEKARDTKAKASKIRENREAQVDSSTGTPRTYRKLSVHAMTVRPVPSPTTPKSP